MATATVQCEVGQRYLVVLRGGHWGSRFVTADGACDTDVQGHLEAVGERHLLPVSDAAAAVTLAEQLRSEEARRCEVLEIELTRRWAGEDFPMWR